MKMVKAERNTTFKVRVTVGSLNYRVEEGVKYKSNGSSQIKEYIRQLTNKMDEGLMSGTGWINFKYTKRV